MLIYLAHKIVEMEYLVIKIGKFNTFKVSRSNEHIVYVK